MEDVITGGHISFISDGTAED